jgi:hypothetical protein
MYSTISTNLFSVDLTGGVSRKTEPGKSRTTEDTISTVDSV